MGKGEGMMWGKGAGGGEFSEPLEAPYLPEPCRDTKKGVSKYCVCLRCRSTLNYSRCSDFVCLSSLGCRCAGIPQQMTPQTKKHIAMNVALAIIITPTHQNELETLAISTSMPERQNKLKRGGM